MSQKYNLSIDAGSDFSQQFAIIHQTTGNPFDLSGYTGSAMIRQQFTDTIPTATFSASIDTPPTSGSFTLSLTWPYTAALTGSCYFYDVDLKQNLTVTRIVEGKVLVNPAVTK